MGLDVRYLLGWSDVHDVSGCLFVINNGRLVDTIFWVPLLVTVKEHDNYRVLRKAWRSGLAVTGRIRSDNANGQVLLALRCRAVPKPQVRVRRPMVPLAATSWRATRRWYTLGRSR